MDRIVSSAPATTEPGMDSQATKQRFYVYFQEEVTELQEQISQLENYALVAGERQDAIEHCLAGIARLSNEVADATGFIPAYDRRTYSQAIKALSEKLQEMRSKFAPRSRFHFKATSKNSSAISLNDAAELAAEKRRLTPGFKAGFGSSTESSIATTPAHLMTPPSERDSKDVVGDLPSFPKNYNEEISRESGPIRKPSFSQATTVDISSHTGLHIILPSSASRATSSGTLSKLDRCIIDMSLPTSSGPPFAGLTLKNTKDSLIVAGHVAGSAHITAVKNSVILVASRQVRIHSCKDVKFYLHCASHPIIEDCSNIQFAPMPTCHTTSAEESIDNQWNQVDDFKWLKTEPSPNWSIIPEAQRLKEEVWTKVIPGRPGFSPDDILKAVEIKKS